MRKSWLIIVIVLSTLLLFACSESDITITADKSVNQPKTMIDIYSPISGTVLPKDTPFTLDYEIVRSKSDDYVKIKVGDKKQAIIARTKGQHHIDGLPAGKHTISITRYDSKGKATGDKALVTVIMQ